MQVYLLENTTNGKYYVGKTVSKNLHWYLSVKRWQANHGNPGRMPVVAAIHKYGFDKFSIQVLTTAETRSQLDDLERLWIIALDSRNSAHGYNICAGGVSGAKRAMPEEIKRKIAIY
jgi:group I intron endonuclease